MTIDQNHAPTDKQFAVTNESRPLRPLRTILIGTVVTLALGILLAFLFPHVNPEKLGEIAGNVVIFLVILPIAVNWLWQTNRKFLASCCVILAALSIACSFGVVHVSRDTTKAYANAVAGEFVAEGSGNDVVLRHPGLGVIVKSPGASFTAEPVAKIGSSSYRWAFLNVSQGKGLVFSVVKQEITTPEEMQEALRELLASFSQALAIQQGTHISPKIDHTNVAWQGEERYAEATGVLGQKPFCVRVFAIEKRRQDFPVTFLTFAFSNDCSEACNLARSFRLTNPTANDSKRDNSKQ